MTAATVPRSPKIATYKVTADPFRAEARLSGTETRGRNG